MSKEQTVEFGRGGSACAGTAAGALIAVGVPAVTMIWGKNLPSAAELTVIFVGIGVGGLIALTTAFFHAVMPSRVGGCGWCSCGSSGAEKDQTGEGVTNQPVK
jgi:hypothetical protein